MNQARSDSGATSLAANCEDEDHYIEAREWLRSAGYSSGEVIVIDGATGSGKTNLAMRLAKDLGAVRVSLDYYLHAGTAGYYVDRLKQEFLSDDIVRFRRSFPFVLVEGICVREALNRIEQPWTTSIYVKQIGSNELWHFLFHLEDFKNRESEPEDLEEPFHSDYTYHAHYCPHENANFTYVRVAD